MPNLEPVVAINNLVVGPGAFELSPNSGLRGRGIDPRDVDAETLMPRAEFEWPTGTSAIAMDRPCWSPGAFQR